MKFKELLENLEDFDGELVTHDIESQFSFVWDDCKLTILGELKFKQLLESDVKIRKGIIILQDKTISESIYDLFLRAQAGYVPKKDYDAWFITKTEYERKKKEELDALVAGAEQREKELNEHPLIKRK